MKKWRDLDVNEKSGVAIAAAYIIFLVLYLIYLCHDCIAPACEAIAQKFKNLAGKFRRNKSYSEVEI